MVLVEDDVRVADAVGQEALGQTFLDKALVEVAVDLLVGELDAPVLVAGFGAMEQTEELLEEIRAASRANLRRRRHCLAVDGRLIADDEEKDEGAAAEEQKDEGQRHQEGSATHRNSPVHGGKVRSSRGRTEWWRCYTRSEEMRSTPKRPAADDWHCFGRGRPLYPPP